MASTNQTTHYDLSQYVATDKPTYLVDYNGDMSKIDAGIYGADSLARTNEASIGTLSNLDTTVKSDLVSAINEVNTQVGTNTGNISTNTQNISANTTSIGNLTNLSTTVKTDLVSATNEVNSKVGNIANLETTVKTDTVSAINEISEFLNIKNFTDFDPSQTGRINVTNATLFSNEGGLHCATNNDGSLAKIYGFIRLNTQSTTATPVISIQTSLRPTQDITINALGICVLTDSSDYNNVVSVDVKIKTTGVVEIEGVNGSAVYRNRIIIHPSLLFIKDFGDTPLPPSE